MSEADESIFWSFLPIGVCKVVQFSSNANCITMSCLKSTYIDDNQVPQRIGIVLWHVHHFHIGQCRWDGNTAHLRSLLPCSSLGPNSAQEIVSGIASVADSCTTGDPRSSVSCTHSQKGRDSAQLRQIGLSTLISNPLLLHSCPSTAPVHVLKFQNEPILLTIINYK